MTSVVVHSRVMNGPLESIARELKFEGDTIMEGLVVSIFIVGAFLGSVGGGVLADKLGRRRTFQLDAIPLVIGAALRYCCSTCGMSILSPMFEEFSLLLQSSCGIHSLLHVESFLCLVTTILLLSDACNVILCSASAQSANVMILGRFLVGIGIGVNTGLVPMYISEVPAFSPPYFPTLNLVFQCDFYLGSSYIMYKISTLHIMYISRWLLQNSEEL